jgi:hypothetical protein
LTVKVQLLLVAAMVAPVSVTLAGLVAVKVGVVAEQPAPVKAVTLLMVKPAVAVSVSVKVMFDWAGLPAPLVRVKVKVEVPLAGIEAGA